MDSFAQESYGSVCPDAMAATAAAAAAEEEAANYFELLLVKAATTEHGRRRHRRDVGIPRAPVSESFPRRRRVNAPSTIDLGNERADTCERRGTSAHARASPHSSLDKQRESSADN